MLATQHRQNERSEMQIAKRFFGFFSVALFGLVALVTLVSTVLILSQWEGVLEFLLGA